MIMSTKVRTCNIVSSIKFNVQFDLEYLAMFLDGNVKYNPSKFPGLIIRRQDPKCTFVLYAKGSAVCLGTKNFSEKNIAIEKFVNNLSALDVHCKIISNTVCNQVGYFSLCESHRRVVCRMTSDESLAERVKALCTFSYEPELYCGLIFRPMEHVVIVAFHTGKAFITGCHTEEMRQAAMQIFLGMKYSYVDYF